MSNSSMQGSTLDDEDEEAMIRELHISGERISELREIFRFIDKDNDGTVSGQELSTLLRLISANYSETQIRALMSKIDINGDGEMSFGEFVRLLYREPTDEFSATRQAFEVFDTDNDGYITKVELRQVMTRIGHEFEDGEIEGMLAEADKDGDGKVTYEEFEAMLRENNDLCGR